MTKFKLCTYVRVCVCVRVYKTWFFGGQLFQNLLVFHEHISNENPYIQGKNTMKYNKLTVAKNTMNYAESMTEWVLEKALQKKYLRRNNEHVESVAVAPSFFLWQYPFKN